MRAVCKYSILALFIVVGLLTSNTLLAEGKPELTIAEATFDFGSVDEGEKVEHEFVLKNTGDVQLNLLRVVPACGCTATNVDMKEISPGSEGKIKVTFDTTGFSGEKLKTVRIYTNDLEAPPAILKMTGTVVRAVTVNPSRLFFGDLVKDQGGRQTFEIVIRKDSAARVIDVINRNPHFKLEKVEKSPTSYKYALIVDKDTPVGEIRDRLIVKLKNDRRSAINIPIFVSVQGVLRLEPQVLSLGIMEGDKIIVKETKLTSYSKEYPISIKDIKANHSAIKARAEKVSDFEQNIKVFVDPTKVEKKLRGVVDIFTTHKEQGKISLNVYGILPPN